MSENIRTLVYFDCETTGLMKEDPKMTELSFVAVGLDDLLDMHSKIEDFKENQDPTLSWVQPRILPKLTLIINPDKKISADATKFSSGLTNEQLSGHAKFEKAVHVIVDFLCHLPGPICLVAHHGKWFDFPLLLLEIETARAELSLNINQIFCVDSHEVIGDIVDQDDAVDEQVESLHKHLLGVAPVRSRTAEDDALNLMRTTAALGSVFTDMVMQKAKKLSSMKK